MEKGVRRTDETNQEPTSSPEIPQNAPGPAACAAVGALPERQLAREEGLEVLLLQLQEPGGGGVEVDGVVGGDAHLCVG